jgi:hypothetical protein
MKLLFDLTIDISQNLRGNIEEIVAKHFGKTENRIVPSIDYKKVHPLLNPR